MRSRDACEGQSYSRVPSAEMYFLLSSGFKAGTGISFSRKDGCHKLIITIDFYSLISRLSNVLMNTDVNNASTGSVAKAQTTNERPQNPQNRPEVSRLLKIFLFLVFGWIFLGISFIIGVRMWWNSPIHPSFAMFGAVAFASVIAFTIVLSLDIVTGSNLAFEFAGLRFTGTSGPVTLWILTFLAIMSTFIIGDFKTLSTSDANPKPPLQRLGSSSMPPCPKGLLAIPTKRCEPSRLPRYN